MNLGCRIRSTRLLYTSPQIQKLGYTIFRCTQRKTHSHTQTHTHTPTHTSRERDEGKGPEERRDARAHRTGKSEEVKFHAAESRDSPRITAVQLTVAVTTATYSDESRQETLAAVVT